MKELVFLINLGEQLLETTGSTSGAYDKSYTLTKQMGFYPDIKDITKQGDNTLLRLSSNKHKVFTRV
jgi:hypothetical protein